MSWQLLTVFVLVCVVLLGQSCMVRANGEGKAEISEDKDAKIKEMTLEIDKNVKKISKLRKLIVQLTKVLSGKIANDVDSQDSCQLKLLECNGQLETLERELDGTSTRILDVKRDYNSSNANVESTDVCKENKEELKRDLEEAQDRLRVSESGLEGCKKEKEKATGDLEEAKHTLKAIKGEFGQCMEEKEKLEEKQGQDDSNFIKTQHALDGCLEKLKEEGGNKIELEQCEDQRKSLSDRLTICKVESKNCSMNLSNVTERLGDCVFEKESHEEELAKVKEKHANCQQKVNQIEVKLEDSEEKLDKTKEEMVACAKNVSVGMKSISSISEELVICQENFKLAEGQIDDLKKENNNTDVKLTDCIGSRVSLDKDLEECRYSIETLLGECESNSTIYKKEIEACQSGNEMFIEECERNMTKFEMEMKECQTNYEALLGECDQNSTDYRREIEEYEIQIKELGRRNEYDEEVEWLQGNLTQALVRASRLDRFKGELEDCELNRDHLGRTLDETKQNYTICQRDASGSDEQINKLKVKISICDSKFIAVSKNLTNILEMLSQEKEKSVVLNTDLERSKGLLNETRVDCQFKNNLLEKKLNTCETDLGSTGSRLAEFERSNFHTQRNISQSSMMLKECELKLIEVSNDSENRKQLMVQLQDDYSKCKMELDNIKFEFDREEVGLNAANSKNMELVEKLSEYKGRLAKLESNIQTLAKCKENETLLQSKLDSMAENNMELINDLSDYKNKTAYLERQLAPMAENLKVTNNKISDLEEELKSEKTNLKELQGEHKSCNVAKKDMEKRILQGEEIFLKYQEEMNDCIRDSSSLQQQLNNSRNTTDEGKKIISTLRDDLGEAKVEIGKLEATIEELNIRQNSCLEKLEKEEKNYHDCRSESVDLARRNTELEGMLASAAGNSEERSQKVTDLMRDLEIARENTSKCEEKHGLCKGREKELERELDKCRKHVETMAQNHTRIVGEVEGKAQGIQKKLQAIDGLQESYRELQQRYSRSVIAVEDCKTEHKKQNAKMAGQIESLQDRLMFLKVAIGDLQRNVSAKDRELRECSVRESQSKFEAEKANRRAADCLQTAEKKIKEERKKHEEVKWQIEEGETRCRAKLEAIARREERMKKEKKVLGEMVEEERRVHGTELKESRREWESRLEMVRRELMECRGRQTGAELEGCRQQLEAAMTEAEECNNQYLAIASRP